jgi:REP element-mobilizing transposase RayT
MAIHKTIDTVEIYFITFTCHQWLPLIKLAEGYEMIYNWFDVLQSKGHTLNGYVIMPNHLHMLLHYTGEGYTLNKLIGNGKRFMAYEIIDILEEQREEKILHKLNQAVKIFDKKRGKKHEIWEDSFDVKHCWTEKFVLQKLNYIHNNPCSGKWRLADSPIHYLHSSASFYVSGKQGGYKVKDYREFLIYGDR